MEIAEFDMQNNVFLTESQLQTISDPGRTVTL